jgi:2-polyprenyl-3-methyl-5-hydroxy-6-metoxy-1,4-benzoquinol methylase
MLNLIEQKELVAQLRWIVKRIPGAWSAYWIYWRWRKWREKSAIYPASNMLIDMGKYPTPSLNAIQSQLCTSEQFDTLVYREWCELLNSPPRFSRKQWEFVYILQSLSQNGCLVEGKSGLGFGCGKEPLPGIYARFGCDVVATDLDSQDAGALGWVNSGQHSSSLSDLWQAAGNAINLDVFTQHVRFDFADMNAIPEIYRSSFDFVWSACALEHLGSLQHGFDFIRSSLDCLKPGGVAVHTTEFNLSSNHETMETPECSVYRKRDIEKFIKQVTDDGFEVAPLNLHTGSRSLDRFIDLPPYRLSPHLKLMLQRFVVTSIGLTIRKPMT